MKMFSFMTKKFFIYAGILVALIVGIIFGLKNGDKKEIVTIVKGEVVQEVSATGKVKPYDDVSMGFDRTGRVAQVYAKVGDRVEVGQVIASLESGEASAEVAKARALLDEEIIKLREVKNTAPISYGDAYRNLEALVRESFAVADNAVRNKADQFFKDVSSSPRFEVSITSGNFVHYFDVTSSVELDLNNRRREVETILVNWNKNITNLNSSNVIELANSSIKDLNIVLVFLNKMAEAINTFTPAEFEYETTVNTYKTTISSARSEVSNAISDIVTAKDKVNSSPLLGTTGEFESVLSQEAKVTQARANLASAEANLRKFMILAPFSGIITVQDAKLGGTVTSGMEVVSMTGQAGEVYVEANISEINIGKIAVGNLVGVTFDAFPGEGKQGVVSYVEPGNFLVDGVVNYKIRVIFQDQISGQGVEERIRSGLTANLKIETARQTDVLTIPAYAVKKEDGKNFVNKVVGDKTQKVEVDLGLVGSNGLISIFSGLEAGDQVEF